MFVARMHFLEPCGVRIKTFDCWDGWREEYIGYTRTWTDCEIAETQVRSHSLPASLLEATGVRKTLLKNLDFQSLPGQGGISIHPPLCYWCVFGRRCAKLPPQSLAGRSACGICVRRAAVP